MVGKNKMAIHRINLQKENAEKPVFPVFIATIQTVHCQLYIYTIYTTVQRHIYFQQT